MQTTLTISNNEAESRYETTVDGVLAIADYRRSDDRITFTHTEVPPAIGGRGIGQALAKYALDDARAQGLRVASSCWFISDYIRDNPEYQDLLVAN